MKKNLHDLMYAVSIDGPADRRVWWRYSPDKWDSSSIVPYAFFNSEHMEYIGKQRVHALFRAPGRTRQRDEQAVPGKTRDAPAQHRIGCPLLTVVSRHFHDTRHLPLDQGPDGIRRYIAGGEAGASREEDQLVPLVDQAFGRGVYAFPLVGDRQPGRHGEPVFPEPFLDHVSAFIQYRSPADAVAAGDHEATFTVSG
jgi:hypothetical protein